MKNNKDIVLQSVQNEGFALMYASEELKNNKEVAFTAVQKSGIAFQFVGAELKSDLDIALVAIKHDIRLMSYVSQSLWTHKDVLNIVAYSFVKDDDCMIDCKRYFPKPLSANLKALQLPILLQDASIEHLKVSLSSFIDDMQGFIAHDIAKFSLLKKELRLPSNTSIDICIDKLRQYHTRLFDRVENRINYLGTPPAGSEELTDFYNQIEFYLCHLDAFFSKDENRPSEAFVERLQLLQSQSACGARFQSETEQLFSLYCLPKDCMSLEKQLAAIASSEAKKVIEAITPDRDSHDINILTYQLHDFLVGNRVHRDHLGHLFEISGLLNLFLRHYTSRNLVEAIQRILKPGTDIEHIFSKYLQENFLAPLSDVELIDITCQLETEWEIRKNKKIENFTLFKNAENQNKALMLRLKLTEDEVSCINQDDLVKLIESKKDIFIESFSKAMQESRQIKKLYQEYFDGDFESDEGLRVWKTKIIAKALEKMGILETFD